MLRSAARKWRTHVSAARSRAGRTGHRAEIFVDAAQQVDQHLPLILLQARQQPAFALEGCDDDLVVRRASLRGQRDRMAAAVVRVGSDGDEPASLHQRQVPAHRTLVEADDVTDARSRDAGFDRQQRHDPPFRDVDAEISLIEHRRAVRQLVRDKSDERRNVAIEIERRSAIGIRDLGRPRSAWLSRERAAAHLCDRHPAHSIEQ